MAIEIVAGPAGSGKSQLVAVELDKERDVLIDFTRLWAAISGIDRLPDGRFPVRRRGDPRTGLVVSAKALLVEEALRRELEKSGNIYLTTSSRDELANLKRRFPDARARIIDPGESVARSRLARPGNGGGGGRVRGGSTALVLPAFELREAKMTVDELGEAVQLLRVELGMIAEGQERLYRLLALVITDQKKQLEINRAPSLRGITGETVN